MKKLLLLSTLTAFGLAGYAQTFVSTSPENRNVVLEEYTGIYCTYCPDGHKRAQQLYDAHPNDVVLVNIHVGYYANPTGNDPDFRTSFGSALDNQAGTCGYPAGSVNRQEFPGLEQTDNNGNPCGATTAMGRGNWTTAANQVLPLSSPVNIAGQATLDLSTRELTVVVEAYYVGNAVNATNKITVAVMQNNVEGPQTGSNLNPGQVLPNGNYNHNHMLRHFMTGQWGDINSNTTSGSFYTNTFTWTVPDDINDVPVDLGNLELAVYVAEGNEDIISGSQVELSVISPNTYDALPAEIDIPEFVCGNELTPKVTIQNMGNETMTSLNILYSVNNSNVQTYEWTGSLATAATTVVELPTMTFSHLGENTFWVATEAPNGMTDEVPANNTSTKTFAPSKNSGNSITVTIVPDDYGSETTWRVKDPNGTVVESGGPYTNGNSTPVNVTINGLANGCHTFEIDDAYGDGICCSYGNGSFTIESNGTTLYTGGQFGSADSRVFNVGGTAGIDDLELVSGLNVYPNPFTTETQLNYIIAEDAEVMLTVYNALGASVISEDLGKKTTGAHTMTISSEGLDAGVYLVNLTVGGVNYTSRVSISK